jgi:hypothetical protein
MIVTQHAVIIAAAVGLVSAITAIRVYHSKKTFHVALIEAVFAVSATMTAAGFLGYEYDRLFRSDALEGGSHSVTNDPHPNAGNQ